MLPPACSLALVSGPVISVSGLSRQPTGLPRHKGGLVLGETGVSSPPPLTLVQADACCDGATYLKLSNLERRVISAAHSQLRYHKRPELHQGVRALMSDMEHPPEETLPVQEHYRLKLSPD